MMGSLLTSGRTRRQIQFWPVAKGQGRDGRRVDQDDTQGELQQAREARCEIWVTLSAVAEGRGPIRLRIDRA